MIQAVTDSALQSQLTQYAEDFQELLGRHNELTRRHEQLKASQDRLVLAGDVLAQRNSSNGDLCFALDARGHLLATSDRLRDLLAWDPSQPATWAQFLTPENQVQLEGLLSRLGQARQPTVEHTTILLHPAGDPHGAHRFELTSLLHPVGDDWQVIGHLNDTPGYGAQTGDAPRQTPRHSNVQQGFMVTDSQGRILTMDAALSALTGYVAADFQGQNFGLILPGQDESALDATFWRALQKKGFWHGETAIVKKSGQLVRQWLSATAVKDHLNRATAFVFSFLDMAQMLSAERTVLDSAYHDALTGLPCLPLFQDLTHERIARAWRGGPRVTLLYIALDHLQWIKDIDGQGCADAVVMATSNRLQEQIRGCDMVARAGFDRFVVLLLGPRSEAELVNIAARMTDSLAAPIVIRKKSVVIHVRIGSARFPQEGIDAPMLLAHAEAQVLLNQPAVCPTVFLENEFNQALSRQELHLAFQPHGKTGSNDSTGISCEAQARWQHPLLGDLAWQDFSEQAAPDHASVNVGIWILKNAGEQLAVWQSQGIHGLTVVINIGPAHLRSDAFTAALIDVTSHTRLSDNWLELTLGAAQNPQFPGIDVNYLRALRTFGVRVSMRNTPVNNTLAQQDRRVPSTTEDLDAQSVQEVTRLDLTDTGEQRVTRTFRKAAPLSAPALYQWVIEQI